MLRKNQTKPSQSPTIRSILPSLFQSAPWPVLADGVALLELRDVGRAVVGVARLEPGMGLRPDVLVEPPVEPGLVARSGCAPSISRP